MTDDQLNRYGMHFLLTSSDTVTSSRAGKMGPVILGRAVVAFVVGTAVGAGGVFFTAGFFTLAATFFSAAGFAVRDSFVVEVGFFFLAGFLNTSATAVMVFCGCIWNGLGAGFFFIGGLVF